MQFGANGGGSSGPDVVARDDGPKRGPVRTAQVPGISSPHAAATEQIPGDRNLSGQNRPLLGIFSPQPRSDRTIFWRQKFVRSKPPAVGNLLTATPQRQDNFLAAEICPVKTAGC